MLIQQKELTYLFLLSLFQVFDSSKISFSVMYLTYLMNYLQFFWESLSTYDNQILK